jgi:hypothetical protein
MFEAVGLSNCTAVMFLNMGEEALPNLALL